LINARVLASRIGFDLQCHRHSPLSRDDLLDDFHFAIDDEVRPALDHRERPVSEHAADLEQ
jgi:hypothetical protein